MLGLLLSPVPAAARPAQVSLDLSPPDEAPATALQMIRLKELLTARLSQEGFVVVPPDGEHDVALSLSFRDSGWLIRAALPTETLARQVTDCGIVLAEDQLELVQKATELVRRASLRADERQPDERRPEERRPEPTEDAASLPAAPAPATLKARAPPATVLALDSSSPAESSEWEASSGLDLIVRTSHVDPMARVGGRLSLGPRLGLHVTAGVSDASNGPLEVIEGQALIGLGYRLAPGRRWQVEAAALGGARLHHYAVAGASGSPIDALALVVLTGGVQVSRHVGLELRIAPGLCSTEYTHLEGDEVAWSRTRFRVEAGIGLVLH